MLYSKWKHISQEIVEHYGEDEIYRQLIHNIIDNVPLKELKQVFTMYSKPKDPYWTDKSSIQDIQIFEVQLDLPLTERMIDLKDEILKQYYGEKNVPSNPRDYKL